MNRIKEGLRWNIGYMKEMILGDSLRFDNQGNYLTRDSLSGLKSNILRDYYIDFRRVVTHYHLWPPMTELDEDGVARADYSRWALTEIGIRYYPITIAQYALGNFELYQDTANSNYRQAFCAQVDWLIKNVRITSHGIAIWEVDYNFLPYNLSLPWVSAMAQGQIISVLLRAYQLTDDADFLNIAERALHSFRHSTDDEGGVTWTSDEGFAFYEEYPSQPPSHILNGHIWAMFGLYDYYRVTGSLNALSLFNAGVETLKKYLPSYDVGFWSTYDLLRKPGYAPIRYHCLHIELLKVLHDITGEGIFDDFVQQWSSYLKFGGGRAKFAFFVAVQRFREYLQNRLGRL